MYQTINFTNRIVILAIACLFLAGAARGATFTVTITGDSSDQTPGDGVCSTAAGFCTFRAAIEEANAFFGADTIAFGIGGAGVKTITPGSAYPNIVDVVAIDAWTQGGAGYTGPPLIELDGTNAGVVFGLTITAGDSQVRGLVINRFFGGVSLQGGGDTIRGCYIGTDSSGTIALGYHQDGILVSSSANTIGGNTSQNRNIIAGGWNGIKLSGAGQNTISGNYIGTDVSGTVALGSIYGVYVDNSNFNTIGGVGKRNVISSNYQAIEIFGSLSVGNVIISNYIGTDAGGTSDLGNSYGLRIENGATGTRIGGVNAGEGNLIAYSTVEGVAILDSATQDNWILGNSIHSNGAPGIDLGWDLVTANDTDDPDAGANNLQNYPVILTAVNVGATTNISASLNSTPNAVFIVQFFSNPSCNPFGFGEGQFLIGTTIVTTDAGGDAAFNFSPGSQVALGQFITATATRSGATFDTSEFSACVQVS